ncbi:hypothetical protein PR202_gb27062 [Eleusine coracana subsp. coracana]|uniref:Plant heme peroxidase family profile domain-containing protein n=1 Tax=Eleusine coracana subsp. coracana TaxID=191504 RepID=A0AAV5FQU0_ELECO|nr:hypothetical protein PR202_ga24123 [Eleusine coracana subsp. coracana]GJN38054.1 hypothetical protein PR202_gb27062 [Eleusine coracana subsp. coracana]
MVHGMVTQLGGPSWKVALGRHDARTASIDAVVNNLPSPGSDVATLVSKFGAKGLDARDLTALSGAHTVGRARCVNFRDHIYGDPTADAAFAAALRGVCPRAGGDGNLAPLEAQRPDTFDNGYFTDLVARRVLLKSDQALFGEGGGATDAIVRAYAANKTAFFDDFVNVMVKMGGLRPGAGTVVEVRRNCRRVN